ncbi:hypothetical protein KEM54_006689, partial [Ascosphaera aggregata]
MISHFDENSGHMAMAKDNALLRLVRRTVPEDISRDPVNKDLSSINPQRRQTDTYGDRNSQIQRDSITAFAPAELRHDSDYDSDGEPKLPPPSIGRDLPTDSNMRFWDRSPTTDSLSGRKRKSSTELDDIPHHKHERPQRSYETPLADPSGVSEDREADIVSDHYELPKLFEELATQLSHFKNNMFDTGQTCRLLIEGMEDAKSNTPSQFCSTEDPVRSVPTPDQSQPPLSNLLTALLPFPVLQHAPEPANPVDSPGENSMHPKDQMPYVNLFAPLALSTRTKLPTSTTTAESGQRAHPDILQEHDLTLSAPSPFDARDFNITLSVSIDVMRQTVVLITIANAQGIPVALRKWIDERLANEMFERDISGLCWGIFQYWVATVRRADLWCQLETWLKSLTNEHSSSHANTFESRFPNIAFNLNRSCFSFHAHEGPHIGTQ